MYKTYTSLSLCVCTAISCVFMCGYVGVILPLVSIKQSVSISVDLNDPACQQQAHRRVVLSARDKVKKAILAIIKEVLSRYWCHLLPDKDGYRRDGGKKRGKSAVLMFWEDWNGGWPWWKNQLTLAWKWTGWSFSTILFVDKYTICCSVDKGHDIVCVCALKCVCSHWLWERNMSTLCVHTNTNITYTYKSTKFSQQKSNIGSYQWSTCLTGLLQMHMCAFAAWSFHTTYSTVFSTY